MATFAGDDSTSSLAADNAGYSTGVAAGDIAIPPGALPANAVAPTITNLAPTPGTQLASRQTPITFDVADVDPGLRMVVITVRYVTIAGTHVVHDGTGFRYPFDSADSVRTGIGGGYHYSVLPRGGWPGDIESLFVYAVDRAGNLEGALP